MALNISNSGYSSHSWIFIWIFKWVRSPDAHVDGYSKTFWSERRSMTLSAYLETRWHGDGNQRVWQHITPNWSAARGGMVLGMVFIRMSASARLGYQSGLPKTVFWKICMPESAGLGLHHRERWTTRPFRRGKSLLQCLGEEKAYCSAIYVIMQGSRWHCWSLGVCME